MHPSSEPTPSDLPVDGTTPQQNRPEPADPADPESQALSEAALRMRLLGKLILPRAPY